MTNTQQQQAQQVCHMTMVFLLWCLWWVVPMVYVLARVAQVAP